MTLTNEEDVDERQSLYVRKYNKMVKQFDELIEIVDAKTSQRKRRRSPQKRRSTCAIGGNHITPPAGENNGGAAATGKVRSNSKTAARSQVDNNRKLVQTITRHLQELKNDSPPDSDCFNPTD